MLETVSKMNGIQDRNMEQTRGDATTRRDECITAQQITQRFKDKEKGQAPTSLQVTATVVSEGVGEEEILAA